MRTTSHLCRQPLCSGVLPTQVAPEIRASLALCHRVASHMPAWVVGVVWGRHQPRLRVHRQCLPQVMVWLRDHQGTHMDTLVDITAVDYPQRAQRFTVVYQLLSVACNQRLEVVVDTAPGEPVPSVTGVWSAAGWYEREVWDMFGVFFPGHPDLRRILTDYGFQGHPLRKDFPLTGYQEVVYRDGEKRVVTQPLELTQEFRRFEWGSPWHHTQ